MTQFVDRFKGKSTKIGKEGILHILEQGFKPLNLGQNYLNLKNNSRILQSKSIDAIKNTSKVQRVQLPPINHKTEERSVNSISNNSSTRMEPSMKSVNKLSEFINQRQRQLRNGMLQYSSKKKKEPIQQNGNSNPFDVPNEMRYQMAQDQMRFLKSFERYKSSKHFSVHRKMSQRQV